MLEGSAACLRKWERRFVGHGGRQEATKKEQKTTRRKQKTKRTEGRGFERRQQQTGTEGSPPDAAAAVAELKVKVSRCDAGVAAQSSCCWCWGLPTLVPGGHHPPSTKWMPPLMMIEFCRLVRQQSQRRQQQQRL